MAGTAFGFDRGFTDFREVFKQFGSGADGFRKIVPQLARRRTRTAASSPTFTSESRTSPTTRRPPSTRASDPTARSRKAARADADWLTDVNQGRRPLARARDGASRPPLRRQPRLRRPRDGFPAPQLEEDGPLERTVVIVAADHGEELFEHDWIGHNVHLYEESVHVPLDHPLSEGQGPPAGHAAGPSPTCSTSRPRSPTSSGCWATASSDRGSSRAAACSPSILGAPGKTASPLADGLGPPALRAARRAATSSFTTRARAKRSSSTSAAIRGRRRTSSPRTRCARPGHRQSLHHWIAVRGARGQLGAVTPERLTREQCENLKALGYTDAECR